MIRRPPRSTRTDTLFPVTTLFRSHGRKVLQVYAKRREDFAAEVDRTLGDPVDYRLPDGGLSFWLRLDTDLAQLEARAAAMGLRFASSRSFMTAADAPRSEERRVGTECVRTRRSRWCECP